MDVFLYFHRLNWKAVFCKMIERLSLTTNTSTNTNRQKKSNYANIRNHKIRSKIFLRDVQHEAFIEIISKYFIVFPSNEYSYSYSSWQLNLSNIKVSWHLLSPYLKQRKGWWYTIISFSIAGDGWNNVLGHVLMHQKILVCAFKIFFPE